MKIEFYGGSDDIIGVRVDGKPDEHGGYIADDGRYSRSFLVTSVGGARGVRVHAIYDGCWSFAVGQIEDGRSLPRDWTFGVEQEHAYSTRLTIASPDYMAVTIEDES